MITCPTCRSLIKVNIDDLEAFRGAYKWHYYLSQCPACKEYATPYDSDRKRIGEIDSFYLPEEIKEALQDRFYAENSGFFSKEDEYER